MNSIAYPVGDSLYLNITNRCTNQCPFCIRYKSRKFNREYDLWLEKEPSVEEIVQAIGDPAKYKQIVFCGYGEPLVRLEVVEEVARKMKVDSRKAVSSKLIRIDTNGLANLFWGRNILPELQGLIDIISISLNAQDAETYDRLCQPAFGEKSYPAILDFIKEAIKYIPKVEATAVELPGVDVEKCRQIAAGLGAGFRLRPYYEETYVR